MHFTRISVRNFRNYQDLELTLNPGVNLFVGHNGQGKTNLVEALYLLVKGESFRPGLPEVWLRLQDQSRSEFGLVKAQAKRKGLIHQIEWQFQQGKKQYLLNGKRTSRGVLSKRGQKNVDS
jgi:DNA replication and repair protein RecF